MNALVRPSQLARFWELHPHTVNTWIRQGRLAAVRSPGNHFRLRVADVRAFCEREGMPVPPFVAGPRAKRVVVAASSEQLRRALTRALKGAASIETFTDPYEAIVAAASAPTDIFALELSQARFDVASAVRALKRVPAASHTTIVVFGMGSRARQTQLERAGAARLLRREQTQDLPRTLSELLGLAPQERTHAAQHDVGKRLL
jgi:excisionase family DNA binding protein